MYGILITGMGAVQMSASTWWQLCMVAGQWHQQVQLQMQTRADKHKLNRQT